MAAAVYSLVYSLAFVTQSRFLLSVMLSSASSWDPRMGRPMGMMPGPGPPSGHGMKGGGKHNEESLGEFFGVVKSYNPDKGRVRLSDLSPEPLSFKRKTAKMHCCCVKSVQSVLPVVPCCHRLWLHSLRCAQRSAWRCLPE